MTGPDSVGRNRQPKANQNKVVITECVAQGTAEPAVHTLQTGWCFYAGLDAAKRSNVWVASQSPAALSMLAAAGAAAGGSPGPDRSRPESLMQVWTSNFSLWSLPKISPMHISTWPETQVSFFYRVSFSTVVAQVLH